MKYTIYFIFLFCFLTACNKPSEGEIIQNDTTLCMTTKHHDETVPDLEIYLKYGQNEFPGYSEFDYDTMFVIGDNGRGCIEDLPYGQYWLMTKGPDLAWGADVFGSMFLELSRFEAEIDTVLVVNEI